MIHKSKYKKVFNLQWSIVLQISETTISLKENNKRNRKCHERADMQCIPYINWIFLQNLIGCGHDNDKKTFISVSGILPSGKPIKFFVLNLNS